jgi:ABC-type polysaccharide/polyol phosphate transport system ATPase subunit
MLSICANDIRVEFPIYNAYARSLRHQFGLGRIANNLNKVLYKKHSVGGNISVESSGRTTITALNGISFEINKGDRVGILGHNGSGKTTLLRTIAGIYEPVSGDLAVEGRITPFFDIGFGMDTDSTGLENISLRGHMLDLNDAQISEITEDIAEFTELGDYLHMPIRTYSTGMMVRLAFGVSTAIRPEILILDEMIGAGDEAFFARAQERLHNFIENTGILVIASHSLAMLHQWCNKGMLLQHGNLLAFGPIDEVIKRYESGEGTVG